MPPKTGRAPLVPLPAHLRSPNCTLAPDGHARVSLREDHQVGDTNAGGGAGRGCVFGSEDWSGRRTCSPCPRASAPRAAGPGLGTSPSRPRTGPGLRAQQPGARDVASLSRRGLLVHNRPCGFDDLISHPRKPQNMRERGTGTCAAKEAGCWLRVARDRKSHFLATPLVSHPQRARVKALEGCFLQKGGFFPSVRPP